MLTAKAIAQYQTIFTENLSRRQDPEERRALTEVVMVLMVGILYGLYNPHQVARELAIAPKRLYSELKQLDARAWRRLLERMMSQAALERLQSYQAHSAATRSRRQASLSIDDTVQKRLGKALSYVWSWYSGQAKKTLAGQDLVGIVLRMGNEIIPLRLVWVSKQGRGGTGKVAVVLKEMEKLKAEFSKAGIDLTQLGVSFDSWWVNEDFSVKLNQMGFDKQVICAKRNLVLETPQERQSLAAYRKQVELLPGWGHSRPAHRLSGNNPTFGKVAVIFFARRRSKAFALLCPQRALRGCEALRLWSNHHSVEVFWKRLKSWLGLGRMQLQGRDGAWAELTLRTLAYLLALPLLGPQAQTLAKLKHWLHRKGSFSQLLQEHFHPIGWGLS